MGKIIKEKEMLYEVLIRTLMKVYALKDMKNYLENAREFNV